MSSSIKTSITKWRFVEMINEKIATMDGYIDGMRIFLVPDEESPSGYTWDGIWTNKIEHLVSSASREILVEYELDVFLPRVLPHGR